VLESTPPELAGDISDFGIMLVGGGANINGIAELINKKTGLRVTTAKNPMDCECIGIARLIEKPSIIPGGILYKNR
jgi:rod shape-determining protein MreB